jgi:hypothetical protein
MLLQFVRYVWDVLTLPFKFGPHAGVGIFYDHATF